MNTPRYKVIPIDPNAAIEVSEISSIPTWQKDLAQLSKHDRNFEDQRYRNTRRDKFNGSNSLHNFEFTEKLQTTIDKLLIKHSRTEYPNTAPTFAQYADHFSYNKILTDNEKLQVEAAKRQREYKKVVYLESEGILKIDRNESIDLRKANQKTRHQNSWLLHTIDNELPDLYECEIQDEGDYLTVLGLKADHASYLKLQAKQKAARKAEDKKRQALIEKAENAAAAANLAQENAAAAVEQAKRV